MCRPPSSPPWRGRGSDLRALQRFDGLEARSHYLYENPTARSLVEGPEPGSARIESLRATEIRIANDGPGGPLRLAVNAYPLWRATVDTAPAPITPGALGTELRMTIPPGSHRVHVFLDPWDLRLGFLLSAIGLAATLALGLALEHAPVGAR